MEKFNKIIHGDLDISSENSQCSIQIVSYLLKKDIPDNLNNLLYEFYKLFFEVTDFMNSKHLGEEFEQARLYLKFKTIIEDPSNAMS